MTGDWRQAGRWSGWVYAAGALLGGGLSAVPSSGIPPVDPDPAAHYASVRGVWPELYACGGHIFIGGQATRSSAT